MIALINAESIEKAGSKYWDASKEKERDLYLVAGITSENFKEQISRVNHFKNVVGYYFMGDVQAMAQVEDWGTEKPVILWYDMSQVEMTEEQMKEQILLTASQVDSRFRLVVNVPKTFSDMRYIHEFAQKFPNVYFEGGYFLHIEGLNLGSLKAEDLPFRVPTFVANKLVTEGNASPYPLVDISTVVRLTWTEGKLTVPKTTKETKVGAKAIPKVSKPKPVKKAKTKQAKRKATLQSLFGNNG